MHLEPQSARFHGEITTEGFRVIIPARRSWFAILFLLAWLVGWAFGEVNAARELLRAGDNTPSAFMALWLVGWTVGGLFAMGTVLWQLVGREVVTANSSALSHRVEVFGLGWNRSYSSSEVKNLRVTEYSTSPSTNQRAWFPPLYGSGIGPVAFDYGARTIRIAPSLEEAEAKMLVRELSLHLPHALSET
jgi:hypothetical protein